MRLLAPRLKNLQKPECTRAMSIKPEGKICEPQSVAGFSQAPDPLLQVSAAAQF